MRDCGDHYFTANPSVESEPRDVDVLLPDVSLTLTSDAGVFSHGRLDDATRILLETAPHPPASGNLLDIGCGYGPIALALAARSPAAQVIAIDTNSRARELTARNAVRNGLTNVSVKEPDQVGADLKFAAIYSNPPVRIGKPAMRRLLTRWLSQLDDDGVAYLVVGKHLGADSLATWLEQSEFGVARLSSRKSFRTLEVRFRKDQR